MSDTLFVFFLIGGMIVVSVLFLVWLDARDKFWKARKEQERLWEQMAEKFRKEKSVHD